MCSSDLTPFGKFQYQCAPMGFCSSSDEACRRGDIALSGIQNIVKIVDDILVFGKNREDIMKTSREIFKRCEQHGITLNRKKYQLGSEVEFAGMIISKDGIKPDPKKIEALTRFPIPTSLTDLRAFVGLATQLGQFAPDLSHEIGRAHV